jgi:hypothetical protein
MIAVQSVHLWQHLSNADQARLRYWVMVDLACMEWQEKPRAWWQDGHQLLLAMKTAAGRERQGDTRPPRGIPGEQPEIPSVLLAK